MTPIQLQDVARKQFENRERSRAQMVRHPRLLFLSFRFSSFEFKDRPHNYIQTSSLKSSNNVHQRTIIISASDIGDEHRNSDFIQRVRDVFLFGKEAL